MNALKTGGGILVTAIGLGFVFPAIAQLRDLGALPALSVALLFLGIVLTTTGVGAVVLGARRVRS
jgi:hypothetical protein